MIIIVIITIVIVTNNVFAQQTFIECRLYVRHYAEYQV